MTPHPEETATHQPYVPDDVQLPEFTAPAVIVGAVLGIVFGASSLYLVLKVGMTVSASIPVAVLSITLFRLFSRLFGIRRATILENNIVQTTGSAGESIAFGVGVTMPAVMLLGFEMDVTRVMVVSVLGGVLGILMMIPLRRAFIVQQHGTLKYPEGTACADVLIVGEEGGTSAKTVFTGFGLAFVFQFLMQGLRMWKEVPSHAVRWFRGAELSLEASPMLLGVGYIIGTRVSCIMLAGAVLSYLVFVPAIHFFGDGLSGPLYPGTKLIRDMTTGEIRQAYLLYVGAGAVATGGIISLCRAIPLIVSSLLAGVRDLRSSITGGVAGRRTDRDLPMSFVALGTLALIVVIWAALPLGTAFSAVSLVGAVLIVLFGFLFVTVSSRLTGEIGSSSNPISGMTVATLLLTCLIFLALGWTSSEERLIALTVAAVVCVASSNGGTTSQDLKTGFLVGATPRAQQWAIVVGAISSALVIGGILMLLNDASTVYSRKDLPQPSSPTRCVAADCNRSGSGRSGHLPRLVCQPSGGPGARHPARQIPGERARPHLLPGRPGHHRPADAARRRLGGPQVRRAADRADGHDHRRHPDTASALGARPAGRLRGAGAGVGARPVAAVCRGRIPAVFHIRAGVCGRSGALAGRPLERQTGGRTKRSRSGNDARRAAVHRLHRRRRHRRRADRLPVLQRPHPEAAGKRGRKPGLGALRLARAALVRRPGGPPAGRRPRLVAEVAFGQQAGRRNLKPAAD